MKVREVLHATWEIFSMMAPATLALLMILHVVGYLARRAGE
jgi:hypothetical protein